MSRVEFGLILFTEKKKKGPSPFVGFFSFWRNLTIYFPPAILRISKISILLRLRQLLFDRFFSHYWTLTYVQRNMHKSPLELTDNRLLLPITLLSQNELIILNYLVLISQYMSFP